MTEDAMLTPSQVAAHLQVTERTVCDWLKKGRLRGVKLGRLWRIPPSALAALVHEDAGADYDAPLTPQEATASEAAWQAYLEGRDPGESLEEVRRELPADVPEWRVIILRPARRYLERLTDDERERIFGALAELQRDPLRGPVKPLRGRPEWSLRVGGRRLLLRVDREQRVLVVTHVGPRGDVYK